MNEKILFLSPLPPPHYGSAMSSQMCLEILQKSNKFEVKNIKLNYSKNVKDVGHFNLDKIKGFFIVKKQIKKLIGEFQPDIIYFVPATSGLGLIRDSYFVKQIKKFSGKKVIFHIRSRITEESWDKNKKILIEMLKGKKAIVLDKSLVEDLHNLIDKKNIYVLPNAIKNELTQKEIDKILKKRKEKESLEILFLSNMDESKGWLKLLLACRILKNKKIKFKGNFIGAWTRKEDEKKFNSIIKEHDLKKEVKYLGKKVEKEKEKFLENSNVLVFPTEYKLETFGRVIIEAMMFGLPVIANGIAAIPTIIQHNKTGFILKKNTVQEIADYLEKLQDTKLREKMGYEGRERFLQEYEIQKYKTEFLKIIEKV